MISVRRTTYHGQEGFLVCGRDTQGHRISIVATTKGAAEHMAAKVRRGEQVSFEDFRERAV